MAEITNTTHKTLVNETSSTGSITNYGGKVTISTGNGGDTVSNKYNSNYDTVNVIYSANFVSINTGAGNDLISLTANTDLNLFNSKQNIIIYNSGDGKISLIGAASLKSIHIDGEETVETNLWTLDSTTARYGTSSNTIITLKGVKSLDGLSLSGKIVTVAKSSVNAKKITLSGDGYTFALADDVPKITKKKAAWAYSNGTATYKSAYKTAGYKLAGDSKSITYAAATTATDLATVKGVVSRLPITVNTRTRSSR